MEVVMELIKKTTILFPPDLHAHLTRLAKQRGVSLGHLIRSACEAHYRSVSIAERLEAVEELSRLELPVSGPAEMKRESVPDPGDLLP